MIGINFSSAKSLVMMSLLEKAVFKIKLVALAFKLIGFIIFIATVRFILPSTILLKTSLLFLVTILMMIHAYE